jgi:formyltetrahydrofolate hydrolase
MGNDQEERELRVKNLQGMLRWAQEHGDLPSNPGEVQEMSEEMKEKADFFYKAINSLTVDVVQKLKDAVITLQMDDSAENAEEKKLEALDTLEEMVDDLNFAEDFNKMGGLLLVSHALDSQFLSVQQQSAEIIALVVGNHEPLQQVALNMGLLRQLQTLLQSATGKGLVAKLLRAISATLNGNPMNSKIFTDGGGANLLADVLREHGDNERIVTKLSFLVSGLVHDYPKISNAIGNNTDMISRLLQILGRPLDIEMTKEQTARALAMLCSKSNECHGKLVVEKETSASLFNARLEEIEQVEEDDSHKEERTHLELLLALLKRKPEETASVSNETSSSMVTLAIAGP